MITKDNFKEVLKFLEFQPNEQENFFEKNFGNSVFLKADFKKEKLIYPENKGLKINTRETCNFSDPENFVVFECINRLLEKGYNPEHLELEPKWKLGHGNKSGRADILVKDEQEKSLLFIECKTVGNEFKKEQKKMFENGGQLFSYLQQDTNTRYLCLYTSDFIENQINYQSAIVKLEDRKEDIKDYNNGNENIKLYKNAHNKKELFEVWKETFNLYFHYNGIFEEDVNAYEIELKPLKTKNLRPLNEAKGIFNTFMEILRHNNISDNANAFNRILSLLLCKIVDEKKAPDAILDFQVKEGGDTPEKIQDRLQKLYAEGMDDYLGQKIVYFEDKIITDIIKLYPRQTPIEKVEDIFKQIKYYTHNEFAIKEVHNKELFEQNARVLNEIIKMLQNYRFGYNKKQQILGDFFELLLNHGVKQSSGQFFTPIPIVRFIIFSIGLDKIIEKKLLNKEKEFLPKTLDYACGAGHFLTESIDELQQHIKNLSTENYTDEKVEYIKHNIEKYQKNTEWAKDYIFGIEKDYRLARTSQIACYLNGDGDANIIYGDGLENHDKLLLEKKFDVVIANPPYSVKSFKNYLNIGEEEYTLFKNLTAQSGEIETLFIERTAQVLKEGGKAGIILPSSILSGGGIYEKTRQLLLENFEIKAITELGAKTFGATGTTTIILFLERRSDDFKIDRKYISEDLYNGVERKRKLEYIDSKDLLEKYIRYQRIDITDYKTLFAENANENIKKTEFWKEYEEWFDNLKEINDLKKKKFFLQQNKEEQKKQLDKLFYQKILKKEEDKFYFFMLSLNDLHQPQRVVIVKSGEKEMEKSFLGYEFSNRKQNEGIKIFKDKNGKPTTLLYDDENHYNSKKANSYILHNFWNNSSIENIEPELENHIQKGQLTNMLDFDRVNFKCLFSLNPQIAKNIETNWNTKNLRIVANIQNGLWKSEKGKLIKIQVLRNTEFLENSKLNYKKALEIEVEENKLKSRILKQNDILLEKSGGSPTQPIGRVRIYKEQSKNFSFGNFIARIKTINENELKQLFLFYFLDYFYQKGLTIYYQHGIRILNLDTEGYSNIKIPLPPLNIQQKIIAECEAIDIEVAQAEEVIKENQKTIAEKMQKIIDGGYEIKRLEEIINTVESGNRPKGGVGNISSGALSLGGEHIHPNNGKIILKTPKYVSLDFYEGSKRGILKENDILICKDGALTGKIALLKNELVGKKAMINEHVFILRCANIIQQKYIFQYLFSSNGQKMLKENITGSAQGGLNSTNLKNIQIPVPPLKVQQQLVSEVDLLEKENTQSQVILETASNKKNKILQNYL